MKPKYYLDTCIWVDFYENRTGLLGEPLGDHAWKLLSLIRATNSRIVISEVLIQELEKKYTVEQISGLFKWFENIIEKKISTKKQINEAKTIAIERMLPKGDALQAIIARDSDAILVSRDNHFRKLRDITKVLPPEKLF